MATKPSNSYCDICDVAVPTGWKNWNDHVAGQRHANLSNPNGYQEGARAPGPPYRDRHRNPANPNHVHWNSPRPDLNLNYGLKNGNIPRPRQSKKVNMTLTANQQIFCDSMERYQMTVCNGATGTGKTYLSCSFAAQQFLKYRVDKILITRPAVAIGKNLGFLPGGIDDKMSPFVQPMVDVFVEHFPFNDLTRWRKEGLIEIVPLPLIQGRTFKNAIIIADEMQNSTPDQMYMLITRLGEGSKLVITGDMNQSQSNKRSANNGLGDLLRRLKTDYPDGGHTEVGVNVVNLQEQDIKRCDIVRVMTRLYRRNGDKKAPPSESEDSDVAATIEQLNVLDASSLTIIR